MFVSDSYTSKSSTLFKLEHKRLPPYQHGDKIPQGNRVINVFLFRALGAAILPVLILIPRLRMRWGDHDRPLFTFVISFIASVLSFRTYKMTGNVTIPVLVPQAPAGGDQNRGLEMIILYWTMSIIVMIVMALRFYARLSIRAIGIDDWLMLATSVILIALTCVLTYQASQGGFRHLFYMKPHQIIVSVKCGAIAEALLVNTLIVKFPNKVNSELRYCSIGGLAIPRRNSSTFSKDIKTR